MGKRGRTSELFTQFPDFLDLLGLGLSSGLNFEKAWSLSLGCVNAGRLKRDLQSVLESLSIGRSREDSFQSLALRWNDRRLRLFFALLSQSMKTGARLQTVLHDQASALRRIRMTELERRAQTASLRLLVPLFLFIFPTLFLLIFAPIVIRFSQGVSLF